MQESNLFPGHKHVQPNSYTSDKAARAAARRDGLDVQEGRCPLPYMPQGRPIRDDVPNATKQELRTLSKGLS